MHRIGQNRLLYVFIRPGQSLLFDCYVQYCKYCWQGFVVVRSGPYKKNDLIHLRLVQVEEQNPDLPPLDRQSDYHNHKKKKCASIYHWLGGETNSLNDYLWVGRSCCIQYLGCSLHFISSLQHYVMSLMRIKTGEQRRQSVCVCLCVCLYVCMCMCKRGLTPPSAMTNWANYAWRVWHWLWRHLFCCYCCCCYYWSVQKQMFSFEVFTPQTYAHASKKHKHTHTCWL